MKIIILEDGVERMEEYPRRNLSEYIAKTACFNMNNNPFRSETITYIAVEDDYVLNENIKSQ